MVVGLLGILKAGAAYVPLDPKNPHAWLRLVLDDIRAPILVTEQKLLAELPEGSFEMIAMFAPARETAASLMAAMVTALVFVSAAASLPIA
jgi:non-ribosomal peptide synthetase component F